MSPAARRRLRRDAVRAYYQGARNEILGVLRCVTHKKDVATITADMKKKDEELKLARKPGATTNVSRFAAMRDSAPRLPPSPYASFVIDYAEKFPWKGPGNKRGAPVEWATLFEKHTMRFPECMVPAVTPRRRHCTPIDTKDFGATPEKTQKTIKTDNAVGALYNKCVLR